MQTIIFRAAIPLITTLMMIFSVFILLRGHNAPGGGFIGGIIAASAFAVYGIAQSEAAIRKALYFKPLTISAFGLLLSVLSGLFSILYDKPFLTGLWHKVDIFHTVVFYISTPLFFDIGVYLVVVGGLSAIILVLEEEE